jgi:hypothetical protein
MVIVEADWGINVLIFHEEHKTVEQHSYPNGGQAGDYTDLRFNRRTGKLDFVVNGQIEMCNDMRQISEKTANVLTRPDNWERLCHGLSIKSERTLEWLRQKGVVP